MKLSACIVVYNGYDEALKAAQTVLHCTRRYPVTLYLVDNASPDGKPQQLPLRRCALRPMLYRQLPRLSFWKCQNDHYLMLDEDLTRPIEIEFCTGSFSGVRTSTFKAVGGFDESYFMYVEDADLTQKMRTRGKVYLVPQYTAIHAWHRAAHRDLKPALWQTGNLLKYFHKWGFKW